MIGGGVVVGVREFGGVKGEGGDEWVVMGKRERGVGEKVIWIGGREEGEGGMEIVEGVKGKKLKGWVGWGVGKVEGMRRRGLGGEKEGKGKGVYGEKVWVKGRLVLMRGEEMVRGFEIREGKMD